MSPFVVYADDYFYIPIEDIEQYNAYKFWSLYGYSLDYTNTISYTENYSGTYTYSGSVTGSLNGTELSTYNITLSSTLSTLSDDTAVTFGSNGSLFGFGSSGDVFKLYMDATDSVTNYHAAPMVCTALSFSDQTGYPEDWEYNKFQCVPTTVNGVTGLIETPEYELTLGGINLDTTQTGYINVNIRESGTGSGGLSGTISLNESESVSGSGNITISGSSSTTEHKIYDIPSIVLTNYNDYKYNLVSSQSNNNFVISFLSEPYSDKNITILNNNNASVGTFNRTSKRIGGYYLVTFEMPNINTTFYRKISIPSDFYPNIIPLYVGFKTNMSDKLYRYIYGDDRTDQLLENGNTNSQQAITNNDTITNSFGTASDSMHNIETTWENNLDTNLQNIPTNSDMYNNNKFIATANWVRTQFERIVLNTPFELLLVFSLILGIALVLIGKVR